MEHRADEILVFDVTPDQNSESDLDRAYQAGQRQAEMGAMLASHELRLNRINGSIERGANNTAELSKKVDDVLAKMATNHAVAEALGKSVQDAAARQISGRGFYLATASVILTLFGVIAAVLEVVHP